MKSVDAEAPSFLGGDLLFSSQLAEGRVFGSNMAKKVIEGEKRANALMLRVIRHERVDGRKLWFGEELFRKVHERATYYYPGWAGHYREGDDIEIGGRKPELARNIPLKMNRLGSWLEEEVAEHVDIPGADLAEGLRVVAFLNYVLSYQLQPFDEGNKRVVRTVTNGLLILGSEEFRIRNSLTPTSSLRLNEAVLEPITKLSNQDSLSELRELVAQCKEVRPDPYGASLEKAVDTGTLNPIELHLANMWAGNLRTRLEEAPVEIGKGSQGEGCKRLVKTLEGRLASLESFIQTQQSGKAHIDQIPLFVFDPKYIV